MCMWIIILYILKKISMNASNIKTQIFHKLSMTPVIIADTFFYDFSL